MTYTIAHRPQPEGMHLWRVTDDDGQSTYFADCPEGTEALLRYLRGTKPPRASVGADGSEP